MAPRVITHRLQRWLAIDRTLRQHGYTDIIVDDVDYNAGVDSSVCSLPLGEGTMDTPSEGSAIPTLARVGAGGRDCPEP